MTHGFSTPSVAIATTPTVIGTFIRHFLALRKRKSATKKSLAEGGPGGGPENQLSYEEGLKVIKRFLEFASLHGLEEIQSFTAMAVPNPRFIRRRVVRIPQTTISQAEDILEKHLSTYGPEGSSGGGLRLVGGSKWWRIRGRPLEGEWIEMQKDYLRRTAKRPSTVTRPPSPTSLHSPTTSNSMQDHHSAAPSSKAHHYLPRRAATIGSVKDNAGGEVIGDRVILYIHGGAYFFSSLDTHRYQIQRHARKAGARAFAPAYRLAPQYPFPCGLLDALTSYLYLLDPPPGAHAPILPTSIILMGDSAGAGMVMSLLIVIREMGLPMPAGASLVSPWVDLTHSMPSIGGWDGGDFIPSSGFHYRPSAVWPPPPGDGIELTRDGRKHVFDEQIQMYCPNNLITHPLVSPINQGSLGGLCPLLITGGGAELLRDEITLLAYRAAEPTTYPPSSLTLAQYPDQTSKIDKYPPTKVHLQIYEGCCHVVTTLSWTHSAKYMYRACANFNIWAFKAAAKAVEHHLNHKMSKRHIKLHTRQATLQNGDSSAPSSPATSATFSAVPSALDLSQPIINGSAAKAANASDLDVDDLESEASSSDVSSTMTDLTADVPAIGVVTVKGVEPVFGSANIVAERVSTHGRIRNFEAVEAIPALNPALRDRIGQISPDGAIKKWLAKRAVWDEKFSAQLDKWRHIKEEDRFQAEKVGYLTRDLHDDRPPLCSLAGWYDQGLARLAGESVDEVGKKTSRGILMWSKMSSRTDKEHAGGDDMEEIRRTVEEQLELEREREPKGKRSGR